MSDVDAEKLAAGMTKLGAPCTSLGRVALTTCVTDRARSDYYEDAQSDDHSAACEKQGGRFYVQKSMHAEYERSKQQSDRSKNGSTR